MSFANPLHRFVPLFCSLTCIWTPLSLAHAEAAAEPGGNAEETASGWKRGDEVLAANPNWIIDEPKVEGMSETRSPRSMTLEGSFGAAWLACPQTSGCNGDGGMSLSVAWQHRPIDWFSWGVRTSAANYAQSWRLEGAEWSLEQDNLAAGLTAEVHPVGWSTLDPYVGIGLGGAAIRATVSESGGPAAASRWLGSPLYSAHAGLRVRISDRWLVGGALEWTNLQANTGEFCPGTVGGVCSANSWSAFSPTGALWNVVATVAFAFGEEL